MMSRLRGVLLTLTALVVIIILVALLVISIISHAYTPPPLPNPNGYAAIITAARTITNNQPDLSKPNEQELQAFVSSSSAALQVIRSNLSEPVQVPVTYSAGYGSTHLPELAKLKLAAYAFAAEAQLAQLQHRPEDAANSDLDIIRLGVKSSHGGLLIDGLVGLAVENIGASQLQKLTGILDTNTCKNVAHQLETIDTERDSWKQTLRQEHYWSSKAFPAYVFLRLFSFNSTRKNEAIWKQKFEITTKSSRTLMINLAARAYTLDKGHPPNGTADLIPAYLKSIPTDPATGLAMGLPASTQSVRDSSRAQRE